MRKLFVIFFTVFLLSLVVGCSLPFGDGLLTISSEGVDFIKHEENKENLAEGDDNAAMPAATETDTEDTEKQDEIDDSNMGLNDEENGSKTSEKNDTNEEANENEETGSNNNNCEKQDHSRILQQIGNDFYIPECAVITSQSFSQKEVSVYLDLADAYWEDLADDYRDKLPQEGFSDSTDFENQKTLIYFKQDGEDSNSSYITIQQDDKGEEGEKDYEKKVYIHLVIKK